MANKVFHAQDTAHPAGVIAEEDAAKGSKGTDEIGPDGDGCFDPGRVRRPGDHGDSSSRHGCDVEDIGGRRGVSNEVLNVGKEGRGEAGRGLGRDDLIGL